MLRAVNFNVKSLICFKSTKDNLMRFIILHCRCSKYLIPFGGIPIPYNKNYILSIGRKLLSLQHFTSTR